MNHAHVKRLEIFYLLHPGTFREHSEKCKSYTDEFLKFLKKKSSRHDYNNFLKQMKKI